MYLSQEIVSALKAHLTILTSERARLDEWPTEARDSATGLHSRATIERLVDSEIALLTALLSD